MKALDADLQAVRERLRSAAEGPAGSASPFLEDILSRPGKLLRPRLLCLSARACLEVRDALGETTAGGEEPLPTAALNAAAAVELLHLASLVHDDIIDEAVLRRGRPSLYALRGPRLAVLAGDWLLARALSLAWKAAGAIGWEGGAEAGTPPPYALALGRMVEAEISQADARFAIPSGRRAYFRRIRAKTALLFGMACAGGARSSGLGSAAPAGRAAALEGALLRYGQAFGMAFQITDDILDFESNPSALGKPAGSDLSSGIFTLPLIEALSAPGSDALRLHLSRPPYKGRRLESIRRAVAGLGGLDAARAQAALWMERGLRALEALPPSAARDELAFLCREQVLRGA